MRALGNPYRVVVASVIEITSCSVTPLARTSCDHFSNCRIGFGSTVALVREESCSVIEKECLVCQCQKPARQQGLLFVIIALPYGRASDTIRRRLQLLLFSWSTCRRFA